ncbi:MAG: Na/Pi cotransporter family protein [Gammaproteobacteria bacterium]
MNLFWQLSAGLGLFLLGMSFIEQSLNTLGGVKLQGFLQKHTKNPLKAVAGGTLATAVLQSSSVISLIVLAFVGAQMIQMRNALGVIIGANLGTTFTGWIVAFFGFKVAFEALSFPLMTFGLIGMALLDRRAAVHQYSKMLAGFGLLLFGLTFMKSAMEGVGADFDLTIFRDHSVAVFFLFGALFTAVIQSSSASMALTLTAVSMGIIDLKSAVAIVIGADLGTTVTVILGAINGTAPKKRVALFHCLFNLVVDLAALLSIVPLLAMVQWLLPSDNPLYLLVGFHNLFNLFGILVFLPFLGAIANWLERRFAEDEESTARYIVHVEPGVTEASLEVLNLEVRRLINMVANLNAVWAGLGESYPDFPTDQPVSAATPHFELKNRYNDIKALEGEILRYMERLRQSSERDEAPPVLDSWTASVRHAVRSVKAIKNIRHDVEHFSSTNNALINTRYRSMRDAMAEYYRQLGNVWSNPGLESNFEDVLELKQLIEHQYAQQTEEIYANVSAPNLPKEEISTLLNVIRQIHTSDLALLSSVNEMLLSKEQIDVFENINVAAK